MRQVPATASTFTCGLISFCAPHSSVYEYIIIILYGDRSRVFIPFSSCISFIIIFFFSIHTPSERFFFSFLFILFLSQYTYLKKRKKPLTEMCFSLSLANVYPSLLFSRPKRRIGEQCAGVGSILCVLRPARCQRHYPGGGRFDCSRWGKK